MIEQTEHGPQKQPPETPRRPEHIEETAQLYNVKGETYTYYIKAEENNLYLLKTAKK